MKTAKNVTQTRQAHPLLPHTAQERGAPAYPPAQDDAPYRDTQSPRAYARNLTLLRAYRAGDRRAGEELVRLNQPLVYRIAGKFSGRYREMDDLVESGTIGLVKAINTFDFSRACAFSTYAVPLIFGEIRRFLRDDGIIKVSREEKRLCALLSAAREEGLARGERVTLTSLAAAVGVCPEDAARALCAANPVRSLDEAYGEEEDLTLEGVLCDEEAGRREFDRLALRMAIEKLPRESRQLILLRYFRDFSQAQTAAFMGLTQVKVSREEKKILAFLRRELSG